jgi:sortase A
MLIGSVLIVGVLGGCASDNPTASVSAVADDPAFETSSTQPAPPSSSATTPTPSPTTTAPTTPSPATPSPTTTASATFIPAATTPETTSPAAAAPPTVQLPQPLAPPDPKTAEAYVELGRILIPRIGVDLPLLEGIALSTLDRGPGHWPGTAMPGQIGNAVIAGHRVSHGKPFRHIDDLQPGDEVTMTTADGTFTYVVTGSEVVDNSAMYIVDQTPEATATLFACHPVGSTKQRYVVHLALRTDG